MPKRNTYSYLIEVLQYTINAKEEQFIRLFCKDDSAKAMEDAFADGDIQHVYKSAKLAYWELLDRATV